MTADGRQRVLARLAHDVGKHVSRAACNMRADDPMPAALVDMLARDLYALRDGLRASEVLDEIVARSAGLLDEDPSVIRCRLLLHEADALEQEVRAGEATAVARAAAIARETHEVLRAAAHAAGNEGR